MTDRVRVASFESRSRGPVDVYRSNDPHTASVLYDHSTDPGIAATLGKKDLNRFAPAKFPTWIEKGGGRFLYTAWSVGHLAGAFWLGGEEFPTNRFPESQEKPPYTAAWRTAYDTPEGDGTTFEGQGIGKRIALAGIANVVRLTRQGGPQGLPPLAESGIWIETGLDNKDAQTLYHYLGNTGRGQDPAGFRDIGEFKPEPEEGSTELDLEHRVGMVVGPGDIQRLVAVAAALIEFEPAELS